MANGEQNKAKIVATLERASSCLMDCATDAAAAAAGISDPERELAGFAEDSLRKAADMFRRIAGVCRGCGFGFNADRN